nr:hypothetical protein [Tanacetum cinerariifolium]
MSNSHQELASPGENGSCKELASPKQTALGKDESNSSIVDSLLKTIWLSIHHVIAMKHWLFQSKRLLVEGLIFLSISLTAWIGKGFSGLETPLFATMLVQPHAAAEEKDEENEVPTAPAPPYPTHKPTPPSHEPITSPPQAQSVTPPSLPLQVQPAPPSSPPQEQPTTSSTSDMTPKYFARDMRVKKLEKQRRSQSSGLKILRKVRGRTKAIDADEDITLVDTETEVELDAELQGRIEKKDDDNAAAKEVNATEPTVFDDEEVTMTMAQALIKMKAEKQDSWMSRWLKGCILRKLNKQQKKSKNKMTLKELKSYNNSMIKNRKTLIGMLEYNKVQTFLKPNRDKEPTKKRGAEETLLQESFKKHRAEVKVSGSHSTQDTSTDDPKEMYEEDVKNMLQIVLKIIRAGRITQAYLSFEDMLKDFDRDALWRLTKEKFSTAMPTEEKEKALWVELKRLYEPNAADKEFGYILQVIKKLELKKLDDLQGGVDDVQRLQENALRDYYCWLKY